MSTLLARRRMVRRRARPAAAASTSVRGASKLDDGQTVNVGAAG